MDIKELLEEDAFDPGNLFNKEKFSTLIINREGFTKRESKAADLLESLLDKDITREETEEIYSQLKDSNARETMIEAIRQATRDSDKTILAQACWECGLDFTPYFVFFTGLATGKDYALALESLTVLQNCENVDEKALGEAIEIAGNADASRNSLVAELRTYLASRKKAQ